MGTEPYLHRKPRKPAPLPAAGSRGLPAGKANYSERMPLMLSKGREEELTKVLFLPVRLAS